MRGRILGIGDRDLAPGGTPAGESTAGIAFGTAMGDVVLVAEHAPEVLCDVGSTVPAGGGLVALGDEFQHADHPPVSAICIARRDRAPLRIEANFAQRGANSSPVKRRFRSF